MENNYTFVHSSTFFYTKLFFPWSANLVMSVDRSCNSSLQTFLELWKTLYTPPSYTPDQLRLVGARVGRGEKGGGGAVTLNCSC